MWIIPKTLSAFVRDTEGLNLDLDERAWMLEQSAMWRSKPSSKQTWLRRLKKDAWMTRLSTRILKPSLHESFEEKYTASLEDIPVSRSVAQESEKERKTQGTYGHISESMSGQLDLFGAFSRMSEVTPRWGYGESCPIWKKMVTERSGDCSQRRKQARLTNASDASSWRNYPTPTALEEKYRIGGNTQASKNLTAMARRGELNSNWATPQSTDGDRINQIRKRSELSERAKKGGCRNLREDVQNWATPNTMDYMETRSAEGVEKIASGARKGRKRPSNLREQVDKKTCDIYNQLNWPTPRAGNPGSRKPGTGGKILAEEAKKHAGPPAPEKSSTSGKNHGSPKLNPNWVEQLMGLEVGWTQLPTEWTDCASSEMALSANVQK